jgi:hypothetical protein
VPGGGVQHLKQLAGRRGQLDDQFRHVLARDRGAAVHRPAAIQHAGPYVGEAAGRLAQAAPAPVQPLEGVLHDVLGGGQVADHHHGQPDKFEVMVAEKVGHGSCGVAAT